MTDRVKCPSCDGYGLLWANSGAHLPHQHACGSCKGTGNMTEAEAMRETERMSAWTQRQKEFYDEKSKAWFDSLSNDHKEEAMFRTREIRGELATVVDAYQLKSADRYRFDRE